MAAVGSPAPPKTLTTQAAQTFWREGNESIAMLLSTPGLTKTKNGRAAPPAVLRSCVLPELLFVHSLLEFGSRAELRDFASRDLDRSAGLRIASVPRFSLRHREGPKTYQSHPISFSECRCNAVHGGINGSRGLRFTDFTRA